MLYLIVFGLALLAGMILKGKMSNLLSFQFKKGWLVLLAFGVQIIAKILASRGIGWVNEYSLVIQGIAYGLVFTAFWMNRKYIGIVVLGMGCMMNFIAIMFNGGKMPVSSDALDQAGMADSISVLTMGEDAKHTLLGDDSQLTFLADIIALPKFLSGMMPVVSVGDLVIAMGLFLLIVEIMIHRSWFCLLKHEKTEV